MIKVEAIYKPQGKNEPKFDRIVVTIGDQVFDPVPIRFMKVGEMKELTKMLEAAAEFGRK
jgi:hypothetical protein